MSANPRSQERPTANALLDAVLPGLSSVELQETAKTAESIDTVRFAFNPWASIPNTTLGGFKFGVQHFVLKRMELIPLVTWKTPVIQPRTGAFSIGSITPGGAFPSGSVGSKVDHVLQFPSESAQKLLEAYGASGPNNLGITILDSLTADQDVDKLESLLIFRAAMETPSSRSIRGVDICLEDLPKFLASEAAELLDKAIADGMPVATEGEMQVVKFRKPTVARAKGRGMIDGIASAVEAARVRALDENSGVLPNTKKDLIAASKGVKDVKALPDKLDEWLLKQFPSFSLDTDVERATRANQSVTEAIRASGQENNLSLRDLIEMQQRTLDQLAQVNELNRKLLMERAEKPAAESAGS